MGCRRETRNAPSPRRGNPVAGRWRRSPAQMLYGSDKARLDRPGVSNITSIQSGRVAIPWPRISDAAYEDSAALGNMLRTKPYKSQNSF
ncbi:hypothetical protein MESS4_590011 [Mesorhizobium sp. STM 4661]|nr:hypothetical protein MESS4_590011 [Mesorhizobium sp. STM 4661]